MANLEGRVAIVTGAGGGIGSATSKVMASRGATVVAADINLEAATRVASEIEADGGRALPVRIDLAQENDIQAMIATAVETFGRLDILDNNAADLSPELAPRDGNVETMEVEVWDRTFRVNVRGTMLACKYALPHMVAAGAGSIINTASNLALQGNVIQAAYSASKSAVIQLTRSIATSHGAKGIRCNTVSPGLTGTRSALEHLPAKLREIVTEETLTPYLGDPYDIAYVVAFLASDEARYVTGQNIVADGGTASHIPGYARLRRMFSGEED